MDAVPSAHMGAASCEVGSSIPEASVAPPPDAAIQKTLPERAGPRPAQPHGRGDFRIALGGEFVDRLAGAACRRIEHKRPQAETSGYGPRKRCAHWWPVGREDFRSRVGGQTLCASFQPSFGARA